MTPPAVTLIDYGMGNLASVAKALERVGAHVSVTADAAIARRAGAMVLPGVGAFGEAAARLDRSGLGQAVAGRIAAGAPVLGICLGLQLLFDGSDEGEGAGLGVFAGRVVRLPTTLKVPQIGWNELQVRPAGRRLAAGLPAPAYVYFVHSYCVRPAEPAIVAATTDYGGEVVAAVARDKVWAVQFHPEKSSSTGLAMLAAFVAMADEVAV